MNGGARFTAGMAALGVAGVINTYKQYTSPGAKLLASKDKLYQEYKDTFSEGVDAAWEMMNKTNIGWHEDYDDLKKKLGNERGTVFIAQNEVRYIEFTRYLKALGIPYTKYQVAYLTGWVNNLFAMGRQSEMFLPDPPLMTPDWWTDYLVHETNKAMKKHLERLTNEQREVFDQMTEANKHGYSQAVLDEWGNYRYRDPTDEIYQCERNYRYYKECLKDDHTPYIDWQVAVLSGWAFKIIEYDNKVQLDKFYDGRFSGKVEDINTEMNETADDSIEATKAREAFQIMLGILALIFVFGIGLYLVCDPAGLEVGILWLLITLVPFCIHWLRKMIKKTKKHSLSSEK
jgi:hypothetical protein